MIELSFAEIFVVILIAIFLIKPSDIPKIARIVKKIIRYIENIKDNITKEFTEIAKDNEDLEIIEGKDIEKINYYMKKICVNGGSYSGEYNLKSIKEAYLNLARNTRDHNSLSKKSDSNNS